MYKIQKVKSKQTELWVHIHVIRFPCIEHWTYVFSTISFHFLVSGSYTWLISLLTVFLQHWLISNLKMQMLEPTGFDHIQAKKQKQRNSLPKLWNFSATAIFIHSLPFSHPCQECVTANVFCWFVSFARSCCSSVGLGHSHSTPSVWYFHSDLYLVHSGDVILAIACNAFQCY